MESGRDPEGRREVPEGGDELDELRDEIRRRYPEGEAGEKQEGQANGEGKEPGGEQTQGREGGEEQEEKTNGGESAEEKKKGGESTEQEPDRAEKAAETGDGGQSPKQDERPESRGEGKEELEGEKNPREPGEQQPEGSEKAAEPGDADRTRAQNEAEADGGQEPHEGRERDADDLDRFRDEVRERYPEEPLEAKDEAEKQSDGPGPPDDSPEDGANRAKERENPDPGVSNRENEAPRAEREREDVRPEQSSRVVSTTERVEVERGGGANEAAPNVEEMRRPPDESRGEGKKAPERPSGAEDIANQPQRAHDLEEKGRLEAANVQPVQEIGTRSDAREGHDAEASSKHEQKPVSVQIEESDNQISSRDLKEGSRD